jgi:hypothetical protein
MTYIPLDNDDDSCRPDLWGQTPLYAPSPGYYLDFESAPPVYESPSPEETLNECSSPLHLSQPNGVSFLPVELCTKKSPKCIDRYRIHLLGMDN